MNNKLSITYLILLIAPLFFGCHGSVKKETGNNGPAGSITFHPGNDKYISVDTTQSVVKWKGSNTFGTHSGYVHISKGELLIENGQLQGGAVEVDMTTIEDEKYGKDNGLIKHLKDPDFFDVKKFPLSAIYISEVEAINSEDIKITANLTIKGITNPVTFPVKMEMKDGMVKATGSLVIDRTNWGIRYNSGKFYDNLADNTISDSIEFNIKIVAKK